MNYKRSSLTGVSFVKLLSVWFQVSIFNNIYFISIAIGAPRKDGDPSLDHLMKSLKSNIDSRRGKNVDILLISEEVMDYGAIL